MAQEAEGSAGLIGKAQAELNLDGEFDWSSSATSRSGDIRNGWIWNTSDSSHFGLVKMLALAGVALLALRIWKGRK